MPFMMQYNMSRGVMEWNNFSEAYTVFTVPMFQRKG